MGQDALQRKRGYTPTDRRYTGQIFDDRTSLYFYNARYYDPLLARFIQADTIVPNPANPQSFNRYAYTLNNPLKYTDPSGHCETPYDRNDRCWAEYNRAVTALGFDPAGLSAWSYWQLNGLMHWLDRGIYFSVIGATWTADNIRDVIEGLNRVENAFGYNATLAMLGLDKSPLLFIKEVAGEGTGGLANARKRWVKLWMKNESSETMIEIVIHELGHIADYVGGGGIEWSLKRGTPWTTGIWQRKWFSGWELNPAGGPASSDYGATHPREDFADTFLWHVEKGQVERRRINPNDQRRAALNVFLGQFR